jgi:hypothetical protein
LVEICISARHYPILTRKVSRDVFVEDWNGKDIRTVVQLELARVKEGSNNKPLSSGDRKVLCDEICERAEGIFQWGKSTKPSYAFHA